MSFGVGLVLFILGSALIALCLWCVPGPGGAAPPPPAPGHGHH